MLNKLKAIARYLRPYKQHDVERQFIELNNIIWNESDKYNQKEEAKRFCLVEGQIICPASVLDKARISKAVQKITGAEPVVIVRGIYLAGSDIIHIYKSFNIRKFYLWWRGFADPRVFIPAALATIKLMRSCKTGSELISLKYKGVEIGDLIYDTLIRYRPNQYTINKIEFKHFRLILRAFLTFYNNDKILRYYNPGYLVTSHNVYAEFGMLSRQLKVYNGGTVFVKDIYSYKCYGPGSNIKEHFLKPNRKIFEVNVNNPDYVNKAKAYFSDRFLGNIDHVDVKNAFGNKKNYTLNDLKCLFPQVDIAKKNVVVMSHAFSDSPHVGEGLLFKDYYDFLEKTLIRLNENNDVNCFVKAHPSSYMWGENGVVENIVEQNNLKKIIIFPADLNTRDIVEIADCIVTAKGTAGLEFSCVGIPAITAGKGYYYGFGITKEPDTIAEYYSELDNCVNIPKLKNNVMTSAAVLLYMVEMNRRHSAILPKQHVMPDENYDDIYIQKYEEILRHMEMGISMFDSFYDEVISDVDTNNA